MDTELQYESPLDPAVAARHRWLAALVEVAGGERVVDLGCGDGATLAVLLGEPAGLVVGIDTSAPALAQAAGRLGDGAPGKLALVHGDLDAPLPLTDRCVDKAICHNVLESLVDPGAFLRETERVLRPGGRLVLSHPDYDTMVFTAPDLALTRRLVHAYCDTQQDWMSAVNGTIGRWLHDIADRSPLTVERTAAAAVLSRGFQAPMLGYMFAQHVAGVLRRAGGFTDAELDGWLASLAEVDQRGAFLWSVNDYAVVCRKPGVRARTA